MKLKTTLILLISHGVVAFIGFALGIYSLPILTAPASPTTQHLSHISSQAIYKAKFTRDLAGSDALHWGDGDVMLSPNYIALSGELAPGPDYKLYLSPTFVETEAEFEAHKKEMQLVGDVNTFKHFSVTLPADTDLTEFNTVIVWCESFDEFITAAKYR